MNQKETDKCEEMFRRLISNPISKVLWSDKPEYSGHRLLYYLDFVSHNFELCCQVHTHWSLLFLLDALTLLSL